MGEVLDMGRAVYATCPECGSTEYRLRLDKAGGDWETILGAECFECGMFIDWIKVEKVADGE